MDCIKRWAFEQHIRQNYIWIVFAVIQVFINRKKIVTKSDFVAISIAFTQSPSVHRPLIKNIKNEKHSISKMYFDFLFYITWTLSIPQISPTNITVGEKSISPEKKR
jgi:hypothetical protein